MAPDQRIKVQVVGQVLDRLRMGGKKTAMACTLVLIMLFMWMRVFLGQRPTAATATAQAPATETAPRRLPVKVQRRELPKIPGRHDTLSRDFFTMKDPACFGRNPARRSAGTETEVPVVSTPSVAEVIHRVARTMKLEAVSRTESPRIFINDQLLEVGSRFPVKDGTQSYEFEVLKIDGDSVLVGCNGVQLTLKLASSLEVVN